jgi:hypothetical protein
MPDSPQQRRTLLGSFGSSRDRFCEGVWACRRRLLRLQGHLPGNHILIVPYHRHTLGHTSRFAFCGWTPRMRSCMGVFGVWRL